MGFSANPDSCKKMRPGHQSEYLVILHLTEGYLSGFGGWMPEIRKVRNVGKFSEDPEIYCPAPSDSQFIIWA